MRRSAQAKYIAPAVHAFLFLAMWALYAGFDEPLMNGPARLPFDILLIADLPFSFFAFGVIFSSTTYGSIAFALWGIVGTLWWHLLGRAIDALIRRIRGNSSGAKPLIDPSQSGATVTPTRRTPPRLSGKTWLMSGGVVITLAIVAIATSWNGPKGNFQKGAIGNFAISPDGRSLLFSRTLNEGTFLYRVTLDTGAVLRLTQAKSGAEFSPTFSQDGKQIVFASIQSADGHSRIYITDIDGSNLHPLFSTDLTNDFAPHFTSDGKHIQFARVAEGITPDPPGPKPWDVYSASLDGKSAAPLTTQHYSVKSGPSFSDDGRHFVYGDGGLSGDSLYVVSLDAPDKSVEPLCFHIPNGPDSPIYVSPNMAPDGRSVIFLAATQGTKAYDYDVFRLDLATITLSKLTANNGYATDLVISPDGNSAVVLRWTSRWGSLPNLSKVYFLNLNTKAVTALPITGTR
jgi:Tol biopolymer transport system component